MNLKFKDTMTDTRLCPCQSNQTYLDCCHTLHNGSRHAQTAEELMRSRYSAYVVHDVDYLVATTLPSQQTLLDIDGIRAWSENSTWLGLEILSFESLPPKHATVSFVAHWQEAGENCQHQEQSYFVTNQDTWYFIDPTVKMSVNRNDECICGNSKKFKKCCGIYL